jgi:hypothetical protein
VIDWLIEQESDERDPWPAERLVFHREDAGEAIEARLGVARR